MITPNKLDEEQKKFVSTLWNGDHDESGYCGTYSVYYRYRYIYDIKSYQKRFSKIDSLINEILPNVLTRMVFEYIGNDAHKYVNLNIFGPTITLSGSIVSYNFACETLSFEKGKEIAISSSYILCDNYFINTVEYAEIAWIILIMFEFLPNTRYNRLREIDQFRRLSKLNSRIDIKLIKSKKCVGTRLHNLYIYNPKEQYKEIYNFLIETPSEKEHIILNLSKVYSYWNDNGILCYIERDLYFILWYDFKVVTNELNLINDSIMYIESIVDQNLKN